MIINLLDAELKLMELLPQNPIEKKVKMGNNPNVNTGISPIYLSPEVSQVDLMELICGFHYRKLTVDIRGKVVPLSLLVRGFEQLFNIKIGNLYKREESIFERDQSIRTAFLDSLREVIHRKGQYRGDL